MKILFMEWKSLGQADIVQEFGERGWKVDFFSVSPGKRKIRD